MTETTGAPESRPDSGDRWARESLSRWRIAAAASALLLLVVLAWAPTKELFQPWRAEQRRYNEAAIDRQRAPVPVRVRQIWIPAAQKADRCGSCHLAAFGEPPLEGERLFDPHPPVPHEPESFGCTYCHSGQGRATDDDAHGNRGAWAHPIFAPGRTEAGCGTCHGGVVLPLPEDVEDAPALVEELDCLGCHGAAGGAAALDAAALEGIPQDWAERHHGLLLPEGTASLDELDLAALDAWLRTRIGAPRLARGKMVFQQLGCLGCHRRGHVGGDVGPDLSGIGDRDARELAAEHEAGPETLPAWLRRHLVAPQELVPESRMPPVDPELLDQESDLDDLVTYLLSLREAPLPPALTPRDRARAAFGLGRDFPTSGRALYSTFCSACHGSQAGGAELETLGMVTPMVGTRGVLATVSPRYLRDSIVRGRRGRYMPAWGPDDGGLELAEIDAIVEYLGSGAFPVEPFETLGGVPDPDRGEVVFAERCAFCHGDAGGEPRFGADLRDPELLRHFTPKVLYEAIARGWVEEGMPAFAFLPKDDLRDVVAFLAPGPGRASSRSGGRGARAGAQLWQGRCAECHGERGEGGDAPLLNSGPYLQWAGDGYLASRIRGHRGEQARAAVGSPSAEDLGAVLDHMRAWSGTVSPARPPAPDPAAVRRGRALYPPRCAECHGDEGRGGTSTALASPDFLSVVSRPFLVMTILEGRKGTPMRAWREQTERPVGLQDAYDLADYILSLGADRAPDAVTQADVEDDQANEGGR